jgi:hypothetical protein
MSVADGVQVVGTDVSLIGVGFAMGTAYAARRHSHRSLQSALERVNSALSNIAVNSIRHAFNCTTRNASCHRF